jgi:sugar fermentation stimulation protein A
MRWPELTRGTLIRRYKRFLADVALESGEVVTAFTPNTGSLLSCAVPGSPAWLSFTADSQRRYPWQWEMVKPCRALVCVNTAVPNQVVAEAAVLQRIPALAGYCEYIREMPFTRGPRFDLCCRVHQQDLLGRCWVEVKSTTLVRGRTAQFPDSVTERGAKHLAELARAVQLGDRAVQVYFIQRADCASFSPADDIDPVYGNAVRAAAKAGVEIVALQARVTQRGVTVAGELPVHL